MRTQTEKTQTADCREALHIVGWEIPIGGGELQHATGDSHSGPHLVITTAKGTEPGVLPVATNDVFILGENIIREIDSIDEATCRDYKEFASEISLEDQICHGV